MGLNGPALRRVLVAGAVAMALSIGLVLALAQFFDSEKQPSPHHTKAVLSQAAEAGSIPSSSSSKASGSDNLALRIKDKTVLCGELAKRGLRKQWLHDRCGHHSILDAGLGKRAAAPSQEGAPAADEEHHQTSMGPTAFYTGRQPFFHGRSWNELAKRLGGSPRAMQRMAADAAKRTGYCTPSGGDRALPETANYSCSPEQILTWARDIGRTLPAPLGPVAKLLASSPSSSSSSSEASAGDPHPTDTPTEHPTDTPTEAPTVAPTTVSPQLSSSSSSTSSSNTQTASPTLVPTEHPTAFPTFTPTHVPSPTPTEKPTPAKPLWQNPAQLPSPSSHLNEEPRPRTLEIESGISHDGLTHGVPDMESTKVVYSKEAAERELGSPVQENQVAVVTLPKGDGSMDEFPAPPAPDRSNVLSSLKKTLHLIPKLPDAAAVRRLAYGLDKKKKVPKTNPPPANMPKSDGVYLDSYKQ